MSCTEKTRNARLREKFGEFAKVCENERVRVCYNPMIVRTSVKKIQKLFIIEGFIFPMFIIHSKGVCTQVQIVFKNNKIDDDRTCTYDGR